MGVLNPLDGVDGDHNADIKLEPSAENINGI
jgi:hypothetical protein